ncbi:MAG: DUF3307 domain-containing protein [Candidatus Eiseniibacteriota bacterium]
MSEESAALAALLVAGHMLGDFVFQTRSMIDRKRQPAWLLLHGLVLGLCHLACLVPFFGRPAIAAASAIVVVHMLVDGLKARLVQRLPKRSLEWFVVDQTLHLATLATAWLVLLPRAVLIDPFGAAAPHLLTLGVVTAAYAFNGNGMSCVVDSMLRRLGMASDEGPPAGRTIGILERMFALTLVLLDHWDALGFLVAAKSLARFKDLDDRRRAEYYLVGTLISLLGATLCALLVGAVLQR